MNAINTFLAGIIGGINSVICNYGWSMVLFTVLIKLLLFPLDFKSRKSMRRMTALQPQVTRLQQKYANDKEKLNLKTSELYRKEKVNPLSGCLPLLLSWPVLMAMFAAMRMVGNTELAKQAIDLITTGTQNSEGWLWVKNLWMPDSPFNSVIPDLNSLKIIDAGVWQSVFAGLSAETQSALASLGNGLAITAENISGETIFAALQQSTVYAAEMQLWAPMPTVNLLITKLSIYANNNGWFILPLLAAGTQFLMTAITPQQPTADQGQAASTNKIMKYFFPIFSLWICTSSNASFALYWVMSNVFAAVETFALNKYFDMKDKQAKEMVGEGTVK